VSRSRLGEARGNAQGRSGGTGPPGGEPSPLRHNTALLRTSGLVKTYRTDGVTVQAVRGVDIELAVGEFVAIMGPSGSGKSTLLHVAAGLEPATGGEIWLRGERVDGLSTANWAILRRRHIGFVFQFFNLLSNMTVAAPGEMQIRSGGLLAGNVIERFDPEGSGIAKCHGLKGSGDRGNGQGAGNGREAERRRESFSRGIEDAGREL